jgi:hypothetical protein
MAAMSQVPVYFIGGPWDQHKVMVQESLLGHVYLVREVKPLKMTEVYKDSVDICCVEHKYYIETAPTPTKIFIALHEVLFQ